MSKVSTICGLTPEAMHAAGVKRPTTTLDAARRQARESGNAVMYRGAHGWKVALPTDLATGSLNLGYSGNYDTLRDELKAEGREVEVAL